MASVHICRLLVTQLNGKMLEFDFRNGPIRRKYDGLKYALKTIEDVVYEISLLDDIPFSAISDSKEKENDMPNKKQKVENEIIDVELETIGDINTAVEIDEDSLLDVSAINSIRERMEIYDKLREDVIKQSRDVQKLSKLAIYSIHRGALKDSRLKLNQAMVFAMKILEIVNLVSLSTVGTLIYAHDKLIVIY